MIHFSSSALRYFLGENTNVNFSFRRVSILSPLNIFLPVPGEYFSSFLDMYSFYLTNAIAPDTFFALQQNLMFFFLIRVRHVI
jgi:hypothetical protein